MFGNREYVSIVTSPNHGLDKDAREKPPRTCQLDVMRDHHDEHSDTIGATLSITEETSICRGECPHGP